MNRLIAQPFELELHTWFEKFATRVTESSVAQEQWVRVGLQRLTSIKKKLVIDYRTGESAATGTHQKLTQAAADLLEDVIAEEGPTEFAWLNRPIHKLQSYLGGEQLSKDLGRLLKIALDNLGEHAGARAIVMELLIWSEGHKQLSGLELKTRVERLVAQARSGSGASLSLEVLLTLAQTDESYIPEFLEKLEAWEQSFVDFERLVEAVVPAELSLLDETAACYDELVELIDSEADWKQLEDALHALQIAWEFAGGQLLPLISLAGENQGEKSYKHLDEFSQATSKFQAGFLTVDAFQRVVSNHQARWNQGAETLRRQWTGQPTKLNLLKSVELSLQTLGKVLSPGDARLAPMTSVYIGSLKSLLQMEQ